MKKVLCILFSLLIGTGLVMAQNSATTNQNGTANLATVTQVGNNTSTVDQTGGAQEATVLQDGTNTSDIDQQTDGGQRQVATVTQKNGANTATVNQFESGNETHNYGPSFATVYQDGTGNSADIDQDETGSGNKGNLRATITQLGNDNSSSQTENAPQSASGQTVTGYQDGDRNSLTQTISSGHTESLSARQYGDDNISWQTSSGSHQTGEVVQDGTFNDAEQHLHGSNNGYSSARVLIDQYGNDNEAYQDLTGSGSSHKNHAVSDQNGDYNDASQILSGRDNSTVVTQSGNTNEAYTDQYGNNHAADVDQTGDENFVWAGQKNGNGNDVSITQSGDRNDVWSDQGELAHSNYAAVPGSDNTGTITQTGNDNMASASQLGDNNVQNTSQTGNDNNAYVYQGWNYTGWGETPVTSTLASYNSDVTITQQSDNNFSAVWQYGGDNNSAAIDQKTGTGNYASIAQGFIYADAAYNFTHPVYNTEDNIASISQTGTDNSTKLFQLGDNNSFSLTQTGAGNTVGGRGLSGLGPIRNGYFDQDGDNNLFTGTQADGATLKHESFQFGDNNEIDLLQGSADQALIQQSGNLNTVNNYQHGGGNISSVVQTGNSNAATVTQQ